MPVTPAAVIDASIARLREPRQPISHRDIRMEAIDVAIARLKTGHAGDDRGGLERPPFADRGRMSPAWQESAWPIPLLAADAVASPGG